MLGRDAGCLANYKSRNAFKIAVISAFFSTEDLKATPPVL